MKKRSVPSGAGNGDHEIVSYCLAHQTPAFEPPADCTLVELGSKGSVSKTGFSRSINAYQLCDYGQEMHPFLAGTLGTFAILKDLKTRQLDKNALINVFQYRRVLMHDTSGVKAKNYPDMWLLSPSEAKSRVLDEELRQLRRPYFYSTPQRIKSVIWQYDTCHRSVDLLRYLAEAVNVGAIGAQEVHLLLNDRSIIPGGFEFGITPIQLYIDLAEKLEATCLSFLKKHRPIDQCPEQIRALNFCSERLGSFLLKKHLIGFFGYFQPRNTFGYMHVISGDDVYAPGT